MVTGVSYENDLSHQPRLQSNGKARVSASITNDAVHYPHKMYMGTGTVIKEFQT